MSVDEINVEMCDFNENFYANLQAKEKINDEVIHCNNTILKSLKKVETKNRANDTKVEQQNELFYKGNELNTPKEIKEK